MAEQDGDHTSERIRYTDNSGRRWYGTLSTENRDGRDIRFELESEDENLPLETGEHIASEIENSSWLKLRGEEGRHLFLARPLITYVTRWPKMDHHGSHPFVLRGIAHDLFESRFAVEPDDVQVSEIWFSSNSALYVLGERLQLNTYDKQVSLRPNQKYEYNIEGLGRVSFHLRALRSSERHKTTIRDHCNVSVRLDTAMKLEQAQRIFHELALFLDFLFGQPTKLPTATLVTPEGNVTLLAGGNTHVSKLDTSGIAAVIRVSAKTDGITAYFGQAELGKTLQVFWNARQKLFQPMNAALEVLHVNNDLLWRLFIALPTLEKFLPTPAQNEGCDDVTEAKEAFFEHSKKDPRAWEFCQKYMSLQDAAKLPTFSMKLTPVVERMRAELCLILGDAA